MFKWIIEADIYRINKTLHEGVPFEKRAKLLSIFRSKDAQLRAMR